MLGSVFLLQFLSYHPIGAGHARPGCFPISAVTGNPPAPHPHLVVILPYLRNIHLAQIPPSKFVKKSEKRC